MSLPSFETKLRDGTPVLVRSVGRGDAHLLQMGLDHLSPRSRYLRFLRPIRQLSDKSLEQFVDVDQVDHIAVGALELMGNDPVPIGVARCIRLETAPAKGEVAVAIVDTHQGRGLGTILLAAVAHAAAAQGIVSQVATVLLENNHMLGLFRELGATSDGVESGVLELSIPIYTDPTAYPQTAAGDVFRRIYQIIELNTGSRDSET